MADIELVVKIDEEEYMLIKQKMQLALGGVPSEAERIIANGTPLPDVEKMLSNLDLSMSYALESDHRSFANPVTGNGWLFDKIIDWRKMIRPYIKEEG